MCLLWRLFMKLWSSGGYLAVTNLRLPKRQRRFPASAMILESTNREGPLFIENLLDIYREGTRDYGDSAVPEML